MRVDDRRLSMETVLKDIKLGEVFESHGMLLLMVHAEISGEFVKYDTFDLRRNVMHGFLVSPADTMVVNLLDAELIIRDSE